MKYRYPLGKCNEATKVSVKNYIALQVLATKSI